MTNFKADIINQCNLTDLNAQRSVNNLNKLVKSYNSLSDLLDKHAPEI